MTPTDFRYTNLKTRLQAFAAERPHAHITKLQQEQWQAIAQAALEQQDWQWAAELADQLLALVPPYADATRIKAQALRELGERQLNATARNYYLSVAQFLQQSLQAESTPPAAKP